MDMNLPDTRSAKTFLQRPEGKVGAVVGVGLLAGGGILLVEYSAVILATMANTFVAVLYGIGILGIIALAMNKQFRMVISHTYKMIMRKATGMIIEIDPIGILKNYIQEMDKKIADVMDNITELKGQIGKLSRSIDDRKATMENCLKLAQQAQKKNDKMNIALNTRKAGRAKDSIERMHKIHQKMEMLYRVLTNMRKKIQFLREDTQDNVLNKESEYESVKAAYKAMSSAKKLLSGGNTEKDLFEQTLQFIADDVGAKMGEMEEFMELSQEFMDRVDLQEGVFDEKGLKLLEKWENGDSLLFDANEKNTILKDVNDPKKDWSANVEVVSPSSSSQFANLFN